MFTGIVEESGKVLSVTDTAEGRRLKIGAGTVTQDLKTGDSVSVSGVCLTVIEHGSDWFQVEAIVQTLNCTKLKSAKSGDAVNLERAMRFSDRLGGHLVTGHVDGIGHVRSITKEGFSNRVTFGFKADMAPLFVEKGSVAVDGVSLTVAALEAQSDNGEFAFTVALIPYTISVTTLGGLRVGDVVNVEADVVGKYVARWLEPTVAEKINKAGLSLSFLAEHGYTKP